MWKLTITQKRKSEFSEYMVTESIEFVSRNITRLTALIETISSHETDIETTYKIEKEGEKA